MILFAVMVKSSLLYRISGRLFAWRRGSRRKPLRGGPCRPRVLLSTTSAQCGSAEWKENVVRDSRDPESRKWENMTIRMF